VQQFDLAVLILRVVFGVFLSLHGFNKFFGPNGLAGTTSWFGSIGMRWPKWQARAAATTEVGAGLFFAAGLLTPLAAGAMIALMIVAIWVAHRKVGFFIFRKGEGWEYCASIAVAAFCVAMMGAGRWSLDHGLGIHFHGWTGATVAAVLGLGGGVLHLASSYRPESK
jgi:putative oxidoreductase